MGRQTRLIDRCQDMLKRLAAHPFPTLIRPCESVAELMVNQMNPQISRICLRTKLDGLTHRHRNRDIRQFSRSNAAPRVSDNACIVPARCLRGEPQREFSRPGCEDQQWSSLAPNVVEKFAGRRFECASQPKNVQDGYVSFSTLQTTDISAMQFSLFGELVLRPVQCLPELADAQAECFELNLAFGRHARTIGKRIRWVYRR